MRRETVLAGRYSGLGLTRGPAPSQSSSAMTTKAASSCIPWQEAEYAGVSAFHAAAPIKY